MANKQRLTWRQGIDGYEDVGLRSGVTVGDAICKLADYEDMEGAGRLVKVRAGIGDIVYAIIGGKVVPMEIKYIYVSSKGRIRYHAAEAVFEKNFREPAFGRDVFTSRCAAENKLQEVQA